MRAHPDRRRTIRGRCATRGLPVAPRGARLFRQGARGGRPHEPRAGPGAHPEAGFAPGQETGSRDRGGAAWLPRRGLDLRGKRRTGSGPPQSPRRSRRTHESAFAARTAIGRRSGSPSMSRRTGSVSGRPRATFFRGRRSTNAWDGSSGEAYASPTGTAGSRSGLGVLSAAPVPPGSAGK